MASMAVSNVEMVYKTEDSRWKWHIAMATYFFLRLLIFHTLLLLKPLLLRFLLLLHPLLR